jgi:Helicase conserved C-terminal domain
MSMGVKSYCTTLSMSSTSNRQKMIEDFELQDVGKFQFVVGTFDTFGLGLNLTRASVAYIMETSWRKSDEMQAIGRIHRLGQECDTKSFKFVTENSIAESQLIALQEERNMNNLQALGYKNGRPMTREEVEAFLAERNINITDPSIQQANVDSVLHRRTDVDLTLS